jgi:hypothetical protein
MDFVSCFSVILDYFGESCHAGIDFVPPDRIGYACTLSYARSDHSAIHDFAALIRLYHAPLRPYARSDDGTIRNDVKHFRSDFSRAGRRSKAFSIREKAIQDANEAAPRTLAFPTRRRALRDVAPETQPRLCQLTPDRCDRMRPNEAFQKCAADPLHQ